MPYKDEEKQRAYKRDWQRAHRAGTRQDADEPGGTPLQSSDEVLVVLAEQVDALRRDRRLKTVERAKAIAQLAALCLKVIETRDVAAQVTDLQSVMRARTLTGRRAA